MVGICGHDPRRRAAGGDCVALADDRLTIIALGVELGHRLLAELLAFGGEALLVGVEQDGADEPAEGGLCGEDADDLASALQLVVEPLQGVRAPDLAPVGPGEGTEGEDSSFARSMSTAAFANRSPNVVSTWSH